MSFRHQRGSNSSKTLQWHRSVGCDTQALSCLSGMLLTCCRCHQLMKFQIPVNTILLNISLHSVFLLLIHFTGKTKKSIQGKFSNLQIYIDFLNPDCFILDIWTWMWMKYLEVRKKKNTLSKKLSSKVNWRGVGELENKIHNAESL